MYSPGLTAPTFSGLDLAARFERIRADEPLGATTSASGLGSGTAAAAEQCDEGNGGWRDAADPDAKLKRLYDTIENGAADPSDLMKDRVAELKVTRDQAHLDAERAEDAIDRAPRHGPF